MPREASEQWVRTWTWAPYGQEPPVRRIVELGHVEDSVFVADSAYWRPDITDARNPRIEIPAEEIAALRLDAVRHEGGGWIMRRDSPLFREEFL